VVSVELDVTRAESVAALATTATDADIVTTMPASWCPAAQSDIEEVKAVFETTTSVRFGCQGVRAGAADNGGGALVDVSSVLLGWVASVATGLQGGHLVAHQFAAHRIGEAGHAGDVAHLGYTDTDMTTEFDCAKERPAGRGTAIVDGVEMGTRRFGRRPDALHQIGALRAVEALRAG